MNYYEERLALLKDIEEKFPQMRGSGDTSKDNKFFTKLIKKGDVLFTTGWYLRNIDDLNKVRDCATNGVVVESVSKFYDSNLNYDHVFSEWRGGDVMSIKIVGLQTMSGRNCLGQMIWKVVRKGKTIYKVKK